MLRTFVVVLVSCASVAAAPAHAQYRFVHLGTIAAPISYPTAINNRNQVVGTSTVAGDASLVHGFLWEDGRLSDLGTLPGGVYSDARDINARGVVAGFAFDEVFRQHAVIWENRRIRELAPPPGGGECTAGAINNRGDVVGSCGLAGSSALVLWRQNAPIVLPVPLGLPFVPTDISDSGVITIVAFDGATGSQYSYRLEGGVLTFLPPAPGYASSVAIRIGASGDIVGYSYVNGNPGTQVATLWSGLDPVRLETPPGAVNSVAADINARGEVVGASWNQDGSGAQALLWVRGALRVLPVPPDHVGADATVINDQGVIGGVERLPTGEYYAVLWVPGR